MKYSVSVKQEDTSDTMEVSPFVEDEAVATLSDGGWECRQAVITADGKYTVAQNVVTAKTLDDLSFSATLEPAQTAILDVGQYYWFIEISNDTLTPKYRKELGIAVGIDEHRIWNTAEVSTVYNVESDTEILETQLDTEIQIQSSSLAVGTIKSIKLLNTDDEILQTIGYISDRTTVDLSQVIITLSESIKTIPTKLMVNI